MRSKRTSLLQTHLRLALIALACLVSLSYSVRPGDFKKCEDSSFCRRIRRLSTFVESESSTSQAFKSPYYIATGSIIVNKKDSTFTASVKSALHPQIDFELKVLFYNDGTSRIKMDQVGERYGKWKRFDGAASWAIDQQPIPADSDTIQFEQNEKETKVQ